MFISQYLKLPSKPCCLSPLLLSLNLDSIGVLGTLSNDDTSDGFLHWSFMVFILEHTTEAVFSLPRLALYCIVGS